MLHKAAAIEAGVGRSAAVAVGHAEQAHGAADQIVGFVAADVAAVGARGGLQINQGFQLVGMGGGRHQQADGGQRGDKKLLP